VVIAGRTIPVAEADPVPGSDRTPPLSAVLPRGATSSASSGVITTNGVTTTNTIVVPTSPSAATPWTTTAPTAPTTPAIPAAPAWSGANPDDPVNALVAGLPSDPTASCAPPSEAARAEARTLANAAEELRIAGRFNDALARFRAVVQIDRCNAWGWLGIGQTATALARPDVAVRALRNAVTLLPRHYGAWTELGKAYETVGDASRAASAYQSALAVRPDYAEAAAGARRVTGRP
jgi:hypothetical protein